MIGTSLIKASTGILATRILGAALQLGLVAIVGALHGLETLGANGLLWSAIVIARAAGTFGLDMNSMKVLTRTIDSNRDIGPMASRFTLFLAGIWAVVLGLSFIAFGGLWMAGSSWAPLFLLSSLACAVSGLQRLWLVQMIVAGRTQIAQLLESVVLPLLAILAAWLTAGNTVSVFLLSQVLCFVVVAASFYLLSPSFKSRPDRIFEVDWRGSLSVAVASVLTAFAVRIPIFFAGMVSLSAAGTYEISQRVQAAGSLGVTAVTTAILPTITRSANNSTKKAVSRKLIGAGAMAAVLPFFLVVLLLAVGRSKLATWFGSEVSEAWLPALLLCIAAFINALTSCISNLLSVAGLGHVFTVISGVQLLFILTALLIVADTSVVYISTVVIVSEVLRSLMLVLSFKYYYK